MIEAREAADVFGLREMAISRFFPIAVHVVWGIVWQAVNSKPLEEKFETWKNSPYPAQDKQLGLRTAGDARSGQLPGRHGAGG